MHSLTKNEMKIWKNVENIQYLRKTKYTGFALEMVTENESWNSMQIIN